MLVEGLQRSQRQRAMAAPTAVAAFPTLRNRDRNYGGGGGCHCEFCVRLWLVASRDAVESEAQGRLGAEGKGGAELGKVGLVQSINSAARLPSSVCLLVILPDSACCFSHFFLCLARSL